MRGWKDLFENPQTSDISDIQDVLAIKTNKISKLETENTQLKNTITELIKYTHHKPECDKWRYGNGTWTDENAKCSCKLTPLLTPLLTPFTG